MIERDTIPPTPASTEELLREVLAAVHGTRDDMARVGTGLAQKIDALAGTVQDLSVTVLELDSRVGRIEEQVLRYANDQIALAARVTALERSRTPFTPAIEEALITIAANLARRTAT